jgi:hypothetical protein
LYEKVFVHLMAIFRVVSLVFMNIKRISGDKSTEMSSAKSLIGVTFDSITASSQDKSLIAL